MIAYNFALNFCMHSSTWRREYHPPGRSRQGKGLPGLRAVNALTRLTDSDSGPSGPCGHTASGRGTTQRQRRESVSIRCARLWRL